MSADEQERYRTLVERAPVGIFEMDADLRCLYVNEHWSELTGVPQADALGDGWGAVVYPDDVDPLLKELARALAEGDDLRIAARYHRHDGDVGWALSTVTVMRDRTGAVTGFVGTFVDITAQRHLEDQVRYNEARLSALFDASSDIMAVLEPDGHWQASPAGTRILGYPTGYEPEGGLLSMVHPDDLELAATAITEVVAGVRSAHEPVRVRIRHIAGHYRFFECVGEDRTDDPVVGGIVIIARDVTDQKVAEDGRAAAETRFRTAFERSPLGIALIDLDGCFLEVNPAFCETVGREACDLVGVDGLSLVVPDDRERVVLQGTERANGRVAGLTEPVRLLHADGRTVWILTDMSLVRDPDGTPAYLIALLTDVTERKKLEERLEYQAYHDPLTHLANRARLRELLERAWARRAEGGRLALLFVDLDRFKHVNDSLGHDAGDEVLLLAARRLERAVRGGDAVARFGGDEFVVICEHVAGHDEAMQIAGRIRESLARTYRVGAGVTHGAASVGVAVDAGQATVDELLREADQAAYRAKDLGRNRVELVGRTIAPAAS